MKSPKLFILALCIVLSPTAAQTTGTIIPTAPTSADPTSAPVIEMLDQGRVRVVGPAGWRLERRGGEGLTLRYELGETGVIVVTVDPQDAALTREEEKKLAKAIGQGLRDAARNEGAQFLIHPRVEPDNRFFLKIRDRTRGADGTVRDQLQMYRAMQLELVRVTAVATVETEAEARPIFAAAEELLDNATLGAGPKPTAFRKTRVRLTIPPDWVERRTDDPNGVVATYANTAHPGARLVVRSKIIPKAAETNPEVQRNAIDALVDGYRTAPQPDSAKPGDVEEPADRPDFVRCVARPVAWNGQTWRSDLRCVVVGDVAVGVEALAPPGDAELSKLADAMARSIRPLVDKPPASDSRSRAPKEPRQQPADRPRLPPTQTPGIPGIPGLGL